MSKLFMIGLKHFAKVAKQLRILFCRVVISYFIVTNTIAAKKKRSDRQICSEMESSGFFSDYSGDGRQSTSSLFQVSIWLFLQN